MWSIKSLLIILFRTKFSTNKVLTPLRDLYMASMNQRGFDVHMSHVIWSILFNFSHKQNYQMSLNDVSRTDTNVPIHLPITDCNAGAL